MREEKEESMKTRRQEEEEGEQGFQINDWSGVRQTFNLTNQLPNYTSAARAVYPVNFCERECVCAGWRCV